MVTIPLTPSALELRARQHGLVTPELVLTLMGWRYDQMMAAIETGALPWVWDISGPRARHRAEWRFWFGQFFSTAALGVDQVISAVLGAQHRRWWWGSEVASRLACSVQHVTALVAARELILTESSPSGAGRKITDDSLRAFLARRLYAP